MQSINVKEEIVEDSLSENEDLEIVNENIIVKSEPIDFEQNEVSSMDILVSNDVSTTNGTSVASDAECPNGFLEEDKTDEPEDEDNQIGEVFFIPNIEMYIYSTFCCIFAYCW